MTKENLNHETGKRLKECLKNNHITQSDLAQKSGYTPQYISYIVTGRKKLSTDAAIAFAKILNIRPEYLLCHDDFKTDVEALWRPHKNRIRLSECVDFLIEYNGYEWISSFISNWGDLDFSPYTDEIKTYSDLIKRGGEYSHNVLKQGQPYYEFKTPSGDTLECSHEEYTTALNEIICYAGFVMNLLYQKNKSKPRKANAANRIPDSL